MSDYHIRNEQQYADRTVQMWHRDILTNYDHAIDLDLLGYCHISHCRKPLYWIEATSNPNKPTSVLREVCNDSKRKVPGFVILHNWQEVVGGWRIGTGQHTRRDYHTEEEMRAALQLLRRQHLANHHSHIVAEYQQHIENN